MRSKRRKFQTSFDRRLREKNVLKQQQIQAELYWQLWTDLIEDYRYPQDDYEPF